MLALLLSLVATVPDPPKLLLVDVDDLGREFLRANPQPFFDQLEDNGRSYRRFYTATVCTPTRAQLHYGVNGSHPDLLCTWLISGPDAQYETPTDGALVPLGRAVTDAGFTAAKVGKWHLSPNTSPLHPFECGWSSYVGVMGNLADFESFTLNVEGTVTSLDGYYLTTLETDLGIAAMLAGHDLVSVSYHAIHKPFHVPPPHLWSGPAPTTDVEKARAMLEALGNELERLTQVAQLLDYSLILFSDNGGLQSLGGAKGSLKDGGIRTNLWVYGPGVEAGADDSIVAVQDLYRTILEFFGIGPTAAMGPDSLSIVPTWSGAPGGRTTLFQDRFKKNGLAPTTSALEWERCVVHGWSKLIQHSAHDVFYEQDEVGETPFYSTFLTPAQVATRDLLRRLLHGFTGLQGPGG